MIDEFPAFAIAAAYAQGKTVVEDASELRYKELDRIADLAQELAKLGVQMSEPEDGFGVLGGRPVQGGEVQPHGDHRLAMALAVAGLASQAPGGCCRRKFCAVPFPEFPLILQALGADLAYSGFGVEVSMYRFGLIGYPWRTALCCPCMWPP